jgi:hypothetical protein
LPEGHLAAPGVTVGRHGYAAIKRGELAWTRNAEDPDRLLFVAPTGYPVGQGNFYGRVFRPAIRSLWPSPHPLSGLRFRDLRHTAASHATPPAGPRRRASRL